MWRVSGAIGVALIAACSFDGVDPAASDGGAAGVDAPDVTVDANLRMACDDFTPKSSYIVPCDIPDPLGALMIGGTYIFDSDNGTLTSPVGLPDLTVASYVRGNAPTDPRVMSVTSLQIGASGSLRLLGDRPVVIAVWGDAVIAGTINLSATLAATRTPAGSGIGCTSAVVGGDAPLGAGGGGGGGGQGHGGDGGDGGAADGGDGASSDSAPLDLRGGCEGAVGGEGGTIIVKGLAGPGGGGLAIVAQTSIAISGSIDAGGAGGGGGFGPNGGGGGGGSGGLIALDAPSIVNEGDLSANGGGGGGGAGNNGSPGFPGTDGQLGDVAAPGGTGTFGGLDGGAGSADTKLTGSDGPDDSGSDLGGGGGGGGAGFVIIWGPHGGAGIESPPAIEM